MKEYSKAVKKADMILYTIVIFWVSISIWASFASLEEVTSGQGRIIASSKIQNALQNFEFSTTKKCRKLVSNHVTRHF